MVEVADIFKKFGPSYLAKFNDKILPQHKKTIRDIINCRTQTMGGQLYYCEHCNEYHYSYHSCGNRHCPKCQNNLAEQWLNKQKNLLLPVHYFMTTFTLHGNLRKISRSNQKLFYQLLFKIAVISMQKLADDPRYVGGMLGIIGVLQTWTKDMTYHPHVHFVVSGGGYSFEKKKWMHARGDFLFPVKALSVIFRAKFRDTLKKENPSLFNSIPRNTWKEKWVVNCIPVGSGENALKYLVPYIFRVAIRNKRIVRVKNNKVCFKYKDSKTNIMKTTTVTAEEFIRRFLQHVLPKGFVKVRYYGIYAHKNKSLLQGVRKILKVKSNNSETIQNNKTPQCPVCGFQLVFITELPKGNINLYPGGAWPKAPPEDERKSLVYEKSYL